MIFQGQKKKGKYRIAVYGHKSIPSREGGIEVVVQELSVRMAEKGHDVVCLNRAGDHDLYENKEEITNGFFRGVKLKKLPTIDKKGLAAVSSSFFAALETAVGSYDLVHIHAEGPAAFCWIPKLFGKKIVVTIHGLDWQRDKWHGFAKKYIHFGERMAVAHADEIIVLSQGLKQYFMDTYCRKTVYIPNGTCPMPHKIANQIKKRFQLEKDSYILYLGRLVPEKKADVLIKAFRNLKTEKKLVLAGADSETDRYTCRLHELAEGDSRILFTDFVKGRIFKELMSNAYVYVLPSKLEGMPLSLLEAISYGNCCVTSDIPECKEVIGNHGLVVEPENVKDLQNSLQYLIDNPSIVEKFREETKQLMDSKYSWDDVAEQTLKRYRLIIEPDTASSTKARVRQKAMTARRISKKHNMKR